MAVTGANAGVLNYTVTYVYDLNNRLTRSTETPANGTAEVTSYTYDRNGNQLTQTINTQTETTAYNGFNQPVTVTQRTGTQQPHLTATYTYRTDGLRHSKTVNGNTIINVWNGSSIVLERNAEGLTLNRYERCITGQLIRSQHHGWYLYNARGDVVQRININSLIRNYRYDAFGNETNPDLSNTNPFRYAGEYFDLETNTYYLRARRYNPRTGRFTQPDPHWNIHNMIYGSEPVKWNERPIDPNDPLGLNTYILKPDILAIMQSGNLYVYCLNNPIRFHDPTGEWVQFVGKALQLVSKYGPKAVDATVKGAKWAGGKIQQGASRVGNTVSGWFGGGGTTKVVNNLVKNADQLKRL
jgi:RHS repeat-associated protein